MGTTAQKPPAVRWSHYTQPYPVPCVVPARSRPADTHLQWSAPVFSLETDGSCRNRQRRTVNILAIELHHGFIDFHVIQIRTGCGLWIGLPHPTMDNRSMTNGIRPPKYIKCFN